jgi:RNA-directed DNA polymerase
MNQTLNALKVDKHPDKTDMGKIEKGFDFLGYYIGQETLLPSTKTIQKSQANLARLYEQNASNERIGQYQRR